MNKIIILLIGCLLWFLPVSAQTLSEAEVTVTMNRAVELHKNKQYSEALEAFLTVGLNIDARKSEVERQVYVCSQTMACSCYYMVKRYSEGYQLAKKLIAGKLEDSEKKDIYHYYVLNGYMIAIGYMNDAQSCQPQKARAILLEILPYCINERDKKTVVSKIALTWCYEGSEHEMNESTEESLLCYKNARKCYKEIGESSLESFVLERIASINSHLGNISEAITCCEQALSLIKDTNRSNKIIELAIRLHRLSKNSGDMKKALNYAQQIESIFASTNDLDTHFIYYTYKGNEAEECSNYNIAEQWFIKAKNIANGNNYYLSSVYLDMGCLYYNMERYGVACEYLQLSLGENKAVCSDNYLAFIYIANIYLKKGNIEKCKDCLDALFSIEPYINEPRQRSKIYATRADYYCHSNNYDLALADYKKADEILASKYPASDVERVGLYAFLGGVEHRLNHYNEAEHYYKLYADAIKAIYGENSLDYIKAQIYLANAHGFAGNIEPGCNSYTLAVSNLKGNIKKRIPYMNTVEREAFWEPLSSLLTRMTPYALKVELYQTEYTKTCYDALLLSKAFLLDSERSIYDIIKREGNETDMQTYMRISSMNNKIKEWEKNYTQYADSILVASNRVAQLERTLVNKYTSIGSITSFMDADYDAVKKTLGKNDVLLDFTDFVSEKYGRCYATYIVNKKQKYPLLKSLFAESQMDSLGIVRPDMFYDKDFASEVIKLLWEPIKEHLTEGATVYYVPSQMLFQVCLESLPLEDGTLLGDHYNFVRLSSARELVKKPEKQNTTSAVLYGGLQYDLEPKVMAQNAQQYDLSSLMVVRGGDIMRGDSIFRELPGSKVEVERIAEILRHSKFKVTPYIGVNGTEESFLSMHGKSPQILHLATHGFYYTSTQANEVDYLRGYRDAMSLSGLIMSGGNIAWQGKELPEGVLGGVLTANNIARLDLSNTDMVVLSACQSGQGNATAEGLYGLQRAFKKAGVGTMVMTLWSVSDKVATEFMIKFYEALVQNDWNKHKAFSFAKSQIKEEYPDPYHWAAFMMLD